VQRVGAYEVLYELKSGGMGSVLLGRRRGPGGFEKLVAIKTIRAELAAAPQVRAMFLDEAALLARLGHPAVAAVHDFGEEGKNLYLVMEYVAGVSLHAVAELAPPPAIAARILAEACRGLHAAHELRDLQGGPLGVVHRDISPDNLLLDFDGHVKVIDFGIALIKNRQAPVTELGTLKGKPPYMSPEQLKNEPIDRRSDVFALGAVLWELLVGDRLFSGDSVYAIARAVEHQEIERPSKLVEHLPPGLDSIVLEALSRDPEKRTPTAAAMAARLDEVVAAAEGETLEQWTHRTLAHEREAHRRWLAQVLSGAAAAAPRMGRATGAVTALAMVPGDAPGAGGATARAVTGVAATSVALDRRTTTGATAQRAEAAGPAATEELAEQVASGEGRGLADGTSAGLPELRDRFGAARHEEEEDAPPRSPSRLTLFLVIVGSMLVLGVGSAFLILRSAPSVGRPTTGAAIDGSLDGSLDAALDGSLIPVEQPPPDAAIVEREPARDAASASRDAREREPRRDARPLPEPRDAAPLEPRHRPAVDARPAPDRPAAPAGQEGATDPATPAGPPGKLRAIAEPYANVFVDGKSVGPTPLLGHSLPAGRHVITFIDPVSGETRLRKTIDVPPSGTVRVELP
jgi:eukaryotic-like serine/threonine-protein kinase